MTEANKPKTGFQDLPDNVGDIFKQHIQLYLTDPEKAHVWDSTPVGGPGWVTTLLLTTTGRKTGKPRHVPLFYLDNGGSYLIVASKGGMENNPVWYLNLLDNPECEIRVNKLHTKARARVLEGAERELAWHKVSVINEAYPRYQARTERQIPVVLLEPIPG